jgi:hypothetical protein
MSKEANPWFEILNIDEEKNQLVLTKKSGTWRLDIKPGTISDETLKELIKRKNDSTKWAMLGVAVFRRENERLKLDHIGL